MASEVGPTQAAEPGIQGQPGNSVSGSRGAPSSHLRKRYIAEDSSPSVSNSQSMARAWTAVPSWPGGSRATRAVTQVLSSQPVCGGHPPSGNWEARSQSKPRRAGASSTEANKARMAYIVGSLQDVPRTQGQPPSRFCLVTISWIDIVISRLAKASELPTSRQPSLHGTLAYLPVPAAAREQYDERYASTQPDRSLDCKFHLVPPFVVLVSLFRLPRVPARPPAFQEDHHDAPGHDPHACLQNCFSRHRLCAPFAFHPTFDIIGKRYLNTCRRPGPAATINMDGKMKKKIGNTSLAPTLPARSSASWRRRTRMKSEWVRRLSPMLVPKRSF